MTKKKKAVDNAAIIAEVAIKGIQEKKGSNILMMDMRGLPNSVTDIMVIASAESSTQVAAIADSVEEEIRKALGESPWHTEGYENALWVLLDYVNVVVHVLQPDVRDYYQIEKLWADAAFKWIND